MNPRLVRAFFLEHGVPEPRCEWKFHPSRNWAFDFAWDGGDWPVALEVQGGIWTRGRHVRGAALLKEWEKLNAAAAMGWRVLFCEPKSLLTTATAQMVKAALERKP